MTFKDIEITIQCCKNSYMSPMKVPSWLQNVASLKTIQANTSSKPPYKNTSNIQFEEPLTRTMASYVLLSRIMQSTSGSWLFATISFLLFCALICNRDEHLVKVNP